MKFLKRLPFWRRYTTKQNASYWANRKEGWREYQETANHPHRSFISYILKQMNWISLVEIGCGSCPNLVNIARSMGGKQLGGVDINPEAINVCNRTFKDGHFRVGSAEDIMMTDKGTDILLSDAFLIYVGPRKIKRYLEEAIRITRNNVVFYEYHSESFWKRLRLRIFSGRHSYNYKKLLKSLGFYDINIIKTPVFEEDNEQEFRYLIIAKPPKEYV